MNQPDRLPLDEADLEEWAVYADHLQTKGDPRGELIDIDVLLSKSPTRAQLEGLHAKARPLLRRRDDSPVVWCVAHAKTLSIGQGRPKLVDEAIELLTSPIGRFVEQVNLSYSPSFDAARWIALGRALPMTCTRFVVEPIDASRAHPADFMAWMPPQVTQLALTNDPLHRIYPDFARSSISRRFELDLSRVDFTDAQLRQIDATATRENAMVRVAKRHRDMGRRVVLGRPGDAAIVDGDWATSIPRWSWLKLQDRFGVLGVRAQLARSFTERWGDIICRASGWFLGDTPIADGDRIPFGDKIVTFRADVATV